MYLKESTALQIVNRNKLENIKLKNFREDTAFFNEFEKAVHQLKAAGAVVSEEDKLRYMLRALPQEYSHLGDLIDVLPEEERAIEYLKSKITIKYSQVKSETEKTEESHTKPSVFTSEMHGKCRGCGKYGHYIKDCYKFEFNNYRARGRGYPGQIRGRGSYRPL